MKRIFIVGFLLLVLVFAQVSFAEDRLVAISARINSEEIQSRDVFTIKTQSGESYFVDSVISSTVLDVFDRDQVSCSARGSGVVCQVTPFDGSDERSVRTDDELYCWGNNAFRDCPIQEDDSLDQYDSELFSVQRFEKSAETEVEVLAWSWGSSSRGVEYTDPDSEEITFEYVWFVSGESAPSETISLSFTKVELALDSGNTVLFDVPDMRVAANSLVFTTVTLSNISTKEDNRVCGNTAHLLSGNDCNDEDVDIRPDATISRNETVAVNVSAQRNETVVVSVDLEDTQSSLETSVDEPDYLDVDDDNDSLLTVESSNRERVLDRGFNVDSSARVRPLDWSEEDRSVIGEYVRNAATLDREEFALAIAYQASGNERVREIRYDSTTDTVQVEHEDEVRLFGFIPVRVTARTVVSRDGNEETAYPWWAFLASKSSEKITSGSGRFGYSVEEGKKL